MILFSSIWPKNPRQSIIAVDKRATLKIGAGFNYVSTQKFEQYLNKFKYEYQSSLDIHLDHLRVMEMSSVHFLFFFGSWILCKQKIVFEDVTETVD